MHLQQAGSQIHVRGNIAILKWSYFINKSGGFNENINNFNSKRFCYAKSLFKWNRIIPKIFEIVSFKNLQK